MERSSPFDTFPLMKFEVRTLYPRQLLPCREDETHSRPGTAPPQCSSLIMATRLPVAGFSTEPGNLSLDVKSSDV